MYQGLVDIKGNKDWKKIFSENELNRLQKIFNFHFKRTVNNPLVLENDYNVILKNHSLVIHADTGKWDDTLGISPKQVKKFINNCKITNLIYALDLLQDKFNNDNNRNQYIEYSEDENHNFYDFKLYWKDYVKENSFTDDMLKKHKSKRKEEIKKEIERVALADIARKKAAVIAAKKAKKAKFFSLIDDIMGAEQIYDNLTPSQKTYLYKCYLKDGKLNKTYLFKSQEALWKNIHNFVPKNADLLVVNPKNWNKNLYLKSLNNLYGTKQLDQVKDIPGFIKLYLNFGNDLSEIPMHLLSSDKNSFFHNNYDLNENGSNKAFLRIVKNLKKGIIPNISLTELSLLNFILSSNDKMSSKFEKKAYITQDDLNSIVNIGEYTDKIKKAGYIDLLPYLMNMSKSNLDNLFKLDFQNILKLLKENKDKKQNIPILSYKHDDLLFEIISKNDVRGYTCGYPFSCQYIGGAGAKFTRYGASDENSTFLVVTKKGEIVAQSWIWTDQGQLTFDSIEMKGGTNKDKLKIGYNKISEMLLDSMEDIDVITSGNSYGIFTDKIDKFIKLKRNSTGNCYDSENQNLVMKR